MDRSARSKCLYRLTYPAHLVRVQTGSCPLFHHNGVIQRLAKKFQPGQTVTGRLETHCVGQSLSAVSMAVICKNSAWRFMTQSDLLGRMNVEMTLEDQNSAQGAHTCTRRSLNAIAAYVKKGAFEKQAT